MSDGYVIKGILTGLTPSEKLYLMQNPDHVMIIRDHADTAISAARRRYPGPGLHNGRADAFRHAYWSALLARDIGPENAERFTTAHEGFSANPASERAMDLRNNLVGIRIGVGAGEHASDSYLEHLVVMAIDRGDLVEAPPAAGQPY